MLDTFRYSIINWIEQKINEQQYKEFTIDSLNNQVTVAELIAFIDSMYDYDPACMNYQVIFVDMLTGELYGLDWISSRNMIELIPETYKRWEHSEITAGQLRDHYSQFDFNKFAWIPVINSPDRSPVLAVDINDDYGILCLFGHMFDRTITEVKEAFWDSNLHLKYPIK